MEIIKITKKNRYYQEIINIYYNWWLKSKKLSLIDIDNMFKDILDNNELPFIYALIINDTLIGTYQINQKDDIDEKEYEPYLANVFIKEQYRNRGFSRVLIEDSIKKTKELGYKTLYLHSRLENYYEKFGFKFLEEVETKYGKKRIFEKDV
jgi:predicted acetyltransferase